MERAPRRRWLSRHAVAYSLTAVVMLFVVVLLPFASRSMVADVVSQSGQLYYLVVPSDRDDVTYRMHLDVLGINEVEQTLTVAVSAAQDCEPRCEEMRFRFASGNFNARQSGAYVPSSDVITFKPETVAFTQTIKVPLSGDPIRYPFDAYGLLLAVSAERPGGAVGGDPATDAVIAGRVAISIESHIPRQVMRPPDAPGGADSLPFVGTLSFERPRYLQILTVLLVLLVTAAAAYAVFLRPLDQLIINSGALVLGVWGIRAILLGTSVAVVTSVDLSLMLVILFLLASITLRTLWLLEEQAGFRILRRRPTKPAPKPPAAPSVTPIADLVPPGPAVMRDVGDLVPLSGEPFASRRS